MTESIMRILSDKVADKIEDHAQSMGLREWTVDEDSGYSEICVWVAEDEADGQWLVNLYQDDDQVVLTLPQLQAAVDTFNRIRRTFK